MSHLAVISVLVLTKAIRIQGEIAKNNSLSEEYTQLHSRFELIYIFKASIKLDRIDRKRKKKSGRERDQSQSLSLT